MRHIALLGDAPDATWVSKADKLIVSLKNAADDEVRKKIIDDNSALWGELKPWLLSISHGKCWFSEAKDCFSHWDVEHYRPKKSAKEDKGDPVDGYWWLAFQWTNFRICGNAGNRKKGTYFPLRTGCKRAQPFGDLRYEQPVLLDPIDEDDPNLISFNLEGRAVPAPYVEDPWERDRVIRSVERYNLDFPALMEKRKIIWSEMWAQLQEYLKELALYHEDPNNLIAKDRSKQAAKRVRALISERAEFSSVARACILSTGDQRAISLIATC